MAHNLDDLAYVTRLDPKEMLRLTVEFPQQCRRALDIASKTVLPELDIEPDLVVLTGLGGSAAGGDFVRCLFEAEGSVPFFVNRDYHLPAFVGSSSLVICSSYSGNTEETLSAYSEAQGRGCQILAVTSGGKLAERAQADGHPVILIPGGQPPRTALGFMLVPVVSACVTLGLLPAPDFEAAFTLLDSCVTEWGVANAFESNPTKQLAQELHGAVSVLYGLGSHQAVVANRWKGQINENAKNMTFANAFPELNHNEILGWVRANEQGVNRWVAVILEDGEESAKMQARRDVTTQLIHERATVHRVSALGDTLWQRMLSLVLMGDFVSLYLAALNGVDPENIDSINILKTELGKIA